MTSSPSRPVRPGGDAGAPPASRSTHAGRLPPSLLVASLLAAVVVVPVAGLQQG